MRTDMIAVTGTVGTEPEHRVSDSGTEMASFRLATNYSRFNAASAQWEQQPANWYTVSTYRSLAVHVADSVHKGERVTVLGRLEISRWQSGERSGTSVKIVADAVGLDLTFASARRAQEGRGQEGRGQEGSPPAVQAGRAAEASPAPGWEPAPPAAGAWPASA